MYYAHIINLVFGIIDWQTDQKELFNGVTTLLSCKCPPSHRDVLAALITVYASVDAAATAINRHGVGRGGLAIANASHQKLVQRRSGAGQLRSELLLGFLR